jgi:hypothetical protein
MHVTLIFFNVKKNIQSLLILFYYKNLNYKEVNSIWHEWLGSSKATRMSGKKIVWLKKIQDDIFSFNIKTTTYWIDHGNPELTC